MVLVPRVEREERSACPDEAQGCGAGPAVLVLLASCPNLRTYASLAPTPLLALGAVSVYLDESILVSREVDKQELQDAALQVGN